MAGGFPGGSTKQKGNTMGTYAARRCAVCREVITGEWIDGEMKTVHLNQPETEHEIVKLPYSEFTEEEKKVKAPRPQ